MPKMLDLIRESAVPANIMRSAARGALSLPASEMMEILVHLTHHSMFGDQARLSLADWEEDSARAVASDPSTPHEVLDYMLAPENRRLALMPALIENSAVGDDKLMTLAMTASEQLATVMLSCPRVLASLDLLHALKSNVNITGESQLKVQQALADANADKPWPHEDDVLAIDALAKFELEHQEEIAAESKKPFKLFVAEGEQPDELAAAAEQPHAKPHHHNPEDTQRISTLQKISRLGVGERVQLAMKGSREERFILIRDGSKVVSLAVLESPKLTDSEVEGFASMKNVQEIVLRGIAGKRKFMKHYAVIKQLVNNPRTPIDVSLPLLSHLLALDLKYLSLNKNVSDTVRKLANKLFRDKNSHK
jgi:hypothetical protein